MKNSQKRVALVFCAAGLLAAATVSVKAESPAQPREGMAQGMLGILGFMATIPLWGGEDHTAGAIMGDLDSAGGDERCP